MVDIAELPPSLAAIRGIRGGHPYYVHGPVHGPLPVLPYVIPLGTVPGTWYLVAGTVVMSGLTAWIS